jgi:hypothetical protein
MNEEKYNNPSHNYNNYFAAWSSVSPFKKVEHESAKKSDNHRQEFSVELNLIEDEIS